MPEWKPLLATRLSTLRLSPAREEEIITELAQHLDDIYRERSAAGVSHDEAIRAALDEIDEHDLLAREMRPLSQAAAPPPIEPGGAGTRLLADSWQDVVYASRTLMASRAWTLVVILLLAVGIGANTALFSATDALLLSSLAVRDPGSLVRLRLAGPGDMATDVDEYGFSRKTPDGRQVRASFSYAAFQELAQDAKDQADLFAQAPFAELNTVVDGPAELASSCFGVTGNFFTVLGVTPLAGRLFGPADDRPDAPPVAVIGSRYWHSRFGGDPSVIGRVMKVNGVPVTIVGVLPPSFTGVQRTLDDPPAIVLPLSLDRQLHSSALENALAAITGSTAAGTGPKTMLTQPTAWWLQVMGRLRPGVTAAQLQARLEGPFQQTARANMAAYLKSLSDEERATSRNRNRTRVPSLLVDSGSHGLYDVDEQSMRSAAILSAVVLAVLLIVCANVANLMLSRAIGRRKEISIRLSLGASRARLVRQFLTEAIVLAAAGAGLGLLAADWGVRLLPPPASSASVFQPRVLAFTALAAILTSLFFGALPALRATRVDVNTALKETGRGIVGRRSVLGRALLVVQIALSLVLIVGAGLFLRTLGNLRRVDPGFDPKNLVLVQFRPTVSGYDMPRTTALYRTLLERLAAVPGVRGAALSQPALLSGSWSSTIFYPEGAPPPVNPREANGHDISRLVVSPDFFRVMGIPIVLGRGLTDRDDASAPHAALVNEAAVKTYFDGANPLGRRFGGTPETSREWEVVGVVRDAKYNELREPVPPTMYVTYMQAPRAAATFELRAGAAPKGIVAAVREAVRQVDPNLPIAKVSTQTEQIERRFAQEKLFAEAYTLFGGIALLLASIGLFGLMSYNVARRTSEMGIRMALGAQRLDLVRMVMRESLSLVGLGVVAGVAVTALAGRLVAAMLFGLAPYDPLTFAAAFGVMVAVSAIAAYLPARRASHVDPLTALRYE